MIAKVSKKKKISSIYKVGRTYIAEQPAKTMAAAWKTGESQCRNESGGRDERDFENDDSEGGK